MRILGIDPGGTTGWAEVDTGHRPLKLIQYGQIPDAEIGVIEAMNEYREDNFVAAMERAHLVVIEDFVFFRKPSNLGADLSPLKTIGALKVYFDQICLETHWLSPGMYNNVSRDVVEALGWKIEAPASRNNHAEAAARNVLEYLRMQVRDERILKLCQKFPKKSKNSSTK